MKELQQDVEHGCCVSQTGFNIVSHTMEDFLHMANHSQQREGGFDDHALVPGVLRAKFEVVWDTIGTAKAEVGE